MNILYIHTHDTGRYILPFGYNVRTPNLMNLAQDGTLFRKAFCAGPTCSPSRAALLTGQSPHSCGMLGLSNFGNTLKDINKHLANYLPTQGYETFLCGMQHEGADNSIGYTKVIRDYSIKSKNNCDMMPTAEELYHEDENTADAAREFIITREKDFFLSCGFFATHRPFLSHANEDDFYTLSPGPLPDTCEIRADMADFTTSVSHADRSIGIVIDALKKSGKYDDTMIISTTDHGIAFPYMKCNLFDSGIGVSLIIKLPEGIGQPKVIDSLVSQIDIYPTICDVLNISKPEWLEGESMMPLFSGQKQKIRNEIFSEITYHVDYEPQRCIRTERYKLIKVYPEAIIPAFENTDNGLSRQYMEANGFDKEKRDELMLFDLILDPNERNNLAYNPRYNEILINLSNDLHEWQQKTSDPLL